MTAPMIYAENLTKVYKSGTHSVTALRNVSLTLPVGSFTALLGRSGCGKTTLLRLIAGLEEPTGGSVTCSLPRSRTGYVFQEARLMPWLSVRDNVRFAEIGRGKKSDRFGDVEQILRTLGLSDFAGAFPYELSGGMAQRAALGRTLFCKSELILMDEPFGALDWFTRRALQEDLLQLWREGGKTIVFVTHDIDEALMLAGLIVVLSEGGIVDSFRIREEYPRKIAGLLPLRERILERLN